MKNKTDKVKPKTFTNITESELQRRIKKANTIYFELSKHRKNLFDIVSDASKK